MSKIFKLTCDIIFIILIIILCLYFVLRLFGITKIYEVKTGSMEDGIHTGDYILIVKKNNYKIGDVVTYKKEDYYVRILNFIIDYKYIIACGFLGLYLLSIFFENKNKKTE